MKKRKRAQASLITVILIILLTLVAVIIVWNVVNFTIKKSSGQVNVDQFALTGEVKYFLAPLAIDKINVSVHRGTGAGNITGVKLVFEFPDSSRSYENRSNYPNELETVVYVITGNMLNPVLSPSDFSKLEKISVYYIYIEDGKEKYTVELDNTEGPSAGGSGGGNPCTPNCNGKQCGSDGCSGSCGTCSAPTPYCNGTGQCSATGCTNGATQSCTQTFGTCSVSGTQTCSNNAWSVCTGATDPRTATCSGKQCGSDGCGGTCSPGCSAPTPNCVNGACTATISNCWDPSANPIPICTWEDLTYVTSQLDKNFILMNDIDLTGQNIDPIGPSTSAYFSGTFNGNYHTISNLVMYKIVIGETNDYVGLFGVVSGGKIFNLKITNSDITGDNNVGGLVGSIENPISGAEIVNCSFSGNVAGNNYIGGLVGNIEDNSYLSINSSSVTGKVRGNDNVGGLVGYMGYYNYITNSYSKANVSGSSNLGGLVGYIDIVSSVYNSYATGNVSSIYGNQVGGFIGQLNGGTVYNSYSTGRARTSGINLGGFIGYKSGSVNYCYRYKKTGDPSDCYNDGGNDGCTSMTSSESYFYNPANSPMSNNWDFTKVWKSNYPTSYPTLKWQG